MVKTKPVFSDTELGIIASAARRVWDEIGHDLLQCVADEKGKDINAVTLSRANVIEVITDASRLEDELKRRHVEGDFLTRVETDLYKTKHSVIDKHLKTVFVHGRYGT
jgi:hypothetical protein